MHPKRTASSAQSDYPAHCNQLFFIPERSVTETTIPVFALPANVASDHPLFNTKLIPLIRNYVGYAPFNNAVSNFSDTLATTTEPPMPAFIIEQQDRQETDGSADDDGLVFHIVAGPGLSRAITAGVDRNTDPGTVLATLTLTPDPTTAKVQMCAPPEAPITTEVNRRRVLATTVPNHPPEQPVMARCRTYVHDNHHYGWTANMYVPTEVMHLNRERKNAASSTPFDVVGLFRAHGLFRARRIFDKLPKSTMILSPGVNTVAALATWCDSLLYFHATRARVTF